VSAPEPKRSTRPQQQQQPVSEVAAVHAAAPPASPAVTAEAPAASAGALGGPRAVFPAHGTQTQRVLDALRRAAEAVEAHVTASGDAELADAAAVLLSHHAVRLRATGSAQLPVRSSNPDPPKSAVAAPHKAAAAAAAAATERWADDEMEGDAAPMQEAAASVNHPSPPPWTTARDWTAVLGLPQQQRREAAPRPRSRSSSSTSGGSGAARRAALAERTRQKQSGAQARRAALEAQRVLRLARRSQTSARGEEGAPTTDSGTSDVTPLTARLARAQAQRDAHLRTVVQKATEESRKVGEVAFITGLEAANRKLELEAKLRASETRRQSALEAKKAAAAAAASVAVDEANERRKQAEAERTARLSAVLADKELKAQALAAERAADVERAEKAAAAERARREELRAAENASAARKAAAIVERLAEAAARRSAHLAARSAGTLSPRSSDCGGTAPSPSSAWPHDEGGAALPPSRGSISRASSPREEGHTLSSPREAGRRSIPEGGLSASLALDFAAAERAAADAAATEAAMQRTAKRIKKLRSRMAGRTQQWPEAPPLQKSAGGSAQHKAMLKLTAALGRAASGGLDVALAHECQRTAIAALDEGRPYASLNAARQTGFLAAVAAATCTATSAMCQGSAAREGGKHIRVAEPLLKALLALLTVVPSNIGAMLCGGTMLTLTGPLLQLLGEEAAAARSHVGEPGSQAACKALCRLFASSLQPQQGDSGMPAALADTVAAQSEDVAELLVHAGCLASCRDILCFGEKPQGEDVPSLYGAVLLLLGALVERIAVGAPGSAASTALMAALRETAFAGILSFLADILLKGRRARTSTTGGLSPTGILVLSPRAQQPMPRNFDNVAASALRCVSSAARLQRETWQTCVGSPGLRAEVTLVSASLLGHCSDMSSPSKDALLAETLLFLGLFASKCSANAAILRWGPPPTLLQRLVALPLKYFTDTASRHVLFPTLLAASVTGPADDGHNLRVVGMDLALSAFTEYLDELEQGQSAMPDGRFAPSSRFGPDMWPHARAALQRQGHVSN
jgi:hypothetical protein